jgi:hypothetical protein
MDKGALQGGVLFGDLEEQPLMLGEIPPVVPEELGQRLKPRVRAHDRAASRVKNKREAPDLLPAKKLDEFLGPEAMEVFHD